MQPTITKQHTRRAVVMIYYLLFLMVYPLLAFFLGNLTAAIVFLVFSPLMYKASGIVRAYHRDRPDERERQAIIEAHFIAYSILVPLIIAVLLSQQYSPEPVPAWVLRVQPYVVLDQLLTLWPFVVLTLTLPAAVMMWLEPDPVRDEIPVTSRS